MNILWDFDGTLFDTYPAFTLVMHDLLRERAEKKTFLNNLKYLFAMRQITLICQKNRLIRLKRKKNLFLQK